MSNIICMYMERLESTHARPLVLLWLFSLKVEEEEDLEPSVFTKVSVG